MALCWSLVAVLCFCIPHVTSSSFVPVRGSTSSVSYNETGGSTRFPDEATVAVEHYKYFISDINFEAVPGKLLLGAADTLYLLNQDLTLETTLNLPTSSSNIDTCTTADRSDNPGLACHNHIRVYQRIPGQDTLLVCGTQAGVEPRCLGVSTLGNNLSAPIGDGQVASDGIISYYPEFTQFGDFRNGKDTDSDPVYLSAGFFPGDSGAGRHFSISYQNITLATPSDPSTLGTENLFQTINANNNWLRFPVVFVGAERADYSAASSPTQRDTDYQFWFIFLRENLVTDDVIYSRLARVCRNDPGSTLSANGAHYFTTLMKARIFCERSKPPTFDSIHTLDYEYNSITSYVFSQEGRYYSNNSPPKRLLYGAFTGPGNGPVGSALCVYPADNSVEASSGSGRTKSVFDVFREDVVSDVESTPVENTFLECDPNGRPDNEQQLLFINPDVSVEQIGDDPILILENDVVTQMVQDTVCIITRDSSSTCVNQDVLFLGLGSGHVLKVVFATDENGAIEPVIVEDIELDDDNAITKMTKQEGSGMLYVSSWSKVYSLPLHRCSRFYTCSECVGYRDPYCVWSDESLECVQSPLSAADGDSQGTVDEALYFQNIHTGSSTGCNYPEIGFVNMSILVDEGMERLSIEVMASGAGSVQFYLESGTATEISTTEGEDYQGLSQVIEFSTPSNETVTVSLIGDSVVEGDEWFIGRLCGTTNDGVILTRESVNITILDDDNVNISFSAINYSIGEEESFLNVTVNKVGTTNFRMLVSLQSSDGTALARADYLKQDLLLTFEPPSTSLHVIIPLVNDDVMEGDERFSLSLSVPDVTRGIKVASPARADVTITNDDEVTVSLSPSSYLVYEEDGPVTVQLVKSGETQLPVQVLLSTIAGTASAPGDFTAVSGAIITFSAEHSSLTATVALVDDAAVEDEEWFLVSLTTATARGVRIEQGEATITVRDRDTVILRLASTAYTWGEGDGEVAVVIEKIGSNERVVSTTLQSNPMSALVEFDYSSPNNYDVQFSPGETQKEVTLVIVDDNELEEAETFSLTLINGPGATYDNNSFADVVIIDDDKVKVQIDVDTCGQSVLEAAGSVEITISRVGLSSIPVEVLVQILNGTATESSDFCRDVSSALLTIPPSPSSSVFLVVSILDDEVVEMREEFFSISLSSSQTRVTVAGNDTAIISISDDDNVVVSFSESSLTASEEMGVVNITLLLSGLHSIPVSVLVSTVSLTAIADQDFEPIAGMVVTFEPGVFSRSVMVTIVNDVIREDTEKFQAQVMVTEGVVTVSITQTTVHILDSDTVQIGFSTTSHSVSERVGWIIVLVEVIGQSETALRANISTESVTATANDGYRPLWTQLTFVPSETTSKQLTLLFFDDSIREEKEEFRVQLTLDPLSCEGVRVGLSTTIIQITDDDSIWVSWGSTQYTVSESQNVLELSLMISGTTSYNYTLLISTSDRSATAGLDYVAQSGLQLEVSPTVSLLTVVLALLDDGEIESLEQLTVTVEPAEGEVGVIISQPDTEVFIVSDDVLQVQFLNTTFTVMEGERSELAVSSTAIAPFDIAISASVDTGSLQHNSLFLLQSTAVIPAGHTITSLPLYLVPGMEGGNETDGVGVVLELEYGTEPSVELGPNSRIALTIVSVDICSSTTDPEEMTMSTSPLPFATPTSSSVSPPTEPGVGGAVRDRSDCLYPSHMLATAVTTVLALLVCLLFSGCALLLFCLRHLRSVHSSEKTAEVCNLPPMKGSGGGALNLSFDTKEDVTSFNESQPATSTSSLAKESLNNLSSIDEEQESGQRNSTFL